LAELGAHKFSAIAQALGISREAVEGVWEFIKSELNPHPAQGVGGPNTHDRDTRAMYILPDVVISRDGGGLKIEVVESKRSLLRLSPIYDQLSKNSVREAVDLSLADRGHVRQYINRAKFFIANINRRRRTLYLIANCLVEHQREFLYRGVRYLKPLSRANVAEQLSIHESTVSRAMAGKYVMVPTGEVIPFSHFFTPSLSIKDVMREVIERENQPLTDTDIRDRLRERGISIARRTVAKYRIALKILPSALR
jgi:RNA polymerase sigma-54 factor